MNLDDQATTPVSEALGLDPLLGPTHALVRYEDGMVADVRIEESYGVRAYLQILEKDCEQLAELIAAHGLPPEAFERASRPGPPWKLEVTDCQVPQLGDIDWTSRYGPVVALEPSERPPLASTASKVRRRLKRLAGWWRPSTTPVLSVSPSPRRSLPGMSVPMRSSYHPEPGELSDLTGNDPGQGLATAPRHAEGAMVCSEWPRISVVTVSYNQCNFLRDCLDSVLGQNYPNLEFIVIDGGSTDGSREILESYRDRLSHLVIEPDRGQSHALNKGFQRATGDVLTWLCSDDRLEPGALEAVASVRTGQDCDIVVGGCRVIDGAGQTNLVHYSGFHRGCLSPLSFGDLASFTSTWQKGLYFYQPELFFTRDLWIRSGSHVKEHLHYAMDYELFLRFALSGARLYAVDQVLACSRQHEDQKTRHDVPMYLPTVKRILSDFHHKLVSLQQL
ncbi:glycosyltransferase family 2 protein [Cyanobium gracile]|uniref:Glycosyltransferase family 2 protein n=1 Tax=Cyanobium gracile UHCC 0281 TaxID=3110309 RepID=A0ABU5SW10_9CYAN|nr:glycosyltransferase family 2 protein [Cyanobium gracile]MEA5442678.1 glycosyltransferase family 2 protein [Cyanobium gracile UHCC 0281]